LEFEMKENKTNNRRNFLKVGGAFLGVTMSAAVFSTIFTACEENEKLPTNPGGNNFVDLKLSEITNLATVGGVYVGAFAENPGTRVIIVRLTESEFVAYSERCPHQGCSVATPPAGSALISCPCHQAQFNISDGSVARQPTGDTINTGLTKYQTSFNTANNTVRILFS